LGLLHADLGLGLIVFVDHLDRQVTDLTTAMVEPKLEGIAHVRADRGHRPAEGADEANLYRLLLRHGGPSGERDGRRPFPIESSSLRFSRKRPSEISGDLSGSPQTQKALSA